MLTKPTIEEPEKAQEVRYRLATPRDQLHLTTLFSAMLRELEPLGYDILPTERNLDFYWTHILQRALLEDRHGLVLAFDGDTPVAATFFTPEYTPFDTPPGRAVAHGIYVHSSHRGQGIAWRLQALAHGQLSTLGFRELVSQITATNEAAFASARSAGAEVRGYTTTVKLER